MRDPLVRADQLASVGSFIIALIGLVGALAGQGWLAVLAFVILLFAMWVLIFLVHRNRKIFRAQRLFLDEQGFKPFPLSEQRLTLQPLSVMGAPNGFTNLGGVPFQIETQDQGALMAVVAPTRENEARVLDLSTPCTQVASVFFLISADYGVKSWHGAKPGEGWDEKVIGHITLTFSDGTKQEQELRLGHHLRDTCPGNQPWAIDQIRSDQTRQVWLSHDKQLALDMLRIDVEDGDKSLESIRILAKLEVDVVPQVSFMEGAGEGEIRESKLPGIKILGVTCWSVQER